MKIEKTMAHPIARRARQGNLPIVCAPGCRERLFGAEEDADVFGADRGVYHDSGDAGADDFARTNHSRALPARAIFGVIDAVDGAGAFVLCDSVTGAGDGEAGGAGVLLDARHADAGDRGGHLDGDQRRAERAVFEQCVAILEGAERRARAGDGFGVLLRLFRSIHHL